MAINFPSSPSDGEEYTDANSGTWVYDIGTNSWTLVAGGSTSAFNFRGGHDFRQSTPPAAPIESGDMWIHDAPTGTIDGVYTGISGQIANGQLVLWDGNSYVMVSGTLPGYPDVGDGEGGTLDSRYLKLGVNAGAQEVSSNAPTTFIGQVAARDGILVTGTSPGTNISGGTTQAGRTFIQLKGPVTDENTERNTLTLYDDEPYIVAEIHPRNLDKNAAELYGMQILNETDGHGSADQRYRGLRSVISEDTGIKVQHLVGVLVTRNQTITDGELVGFACQIYNSNADNAYSIYSNGDANSYHRGKIIVGETDTPQSSDANTAQAVISPDAIYINHGVTNPDSSNLSLNRFGAGNGHFIRFKNSGVFSGFIGRATNGVLYATDSTGTPAFVELGDVRNRTFTDFSGNAADTLKLLQPKTNGFNPAQLQAVVANAVTGTENAEESIGTLYDYDGSVVETDVPEPSSEELEYQEFVQNDEVVTTVTRTRTWTATGTRPVYQGVDQTKLIPLLTKALQEALERIEALETAAGY